MLQTEQQKFKIFQDYLNRARELSGQTTTAPYNSPQAISAATPYAEGGVTQAYKPIRVNDRYGGQRESFQGVLLPRCLGLFIPMQSGSINPGRDGGSNMTLNLTQNISGPDPSTITRR